MKVRCQLGWTALVLVATIGCAATRADQRPLLEPTGPCPEQTRADLASEINRLWFVTDPSLLACGLPKLAAAPADAAALALAAKGYSLLADQTTDLKQREQLAREGERLAQAALDADPRSGAAHYFLAVNLGIRVQEDTLAAIANLGTLKEHLERAVDLSPGEDAGGPLRVMGLLYVKAPPWPQSIGDPEAGRELLDRAVQEHPEHPLNHLFLARALWAVSGADAADAIRGQLKQTREIFASPDWSGLAPRWQTDIDQLESEVNQTKS